MQTLRYKQNPWKYLVTLSCDNEEHDEDFEDFGTERRCVILPREHEDVGAAPGQAVAGGVDFVLAGERVLGGVVRHVVVVGKVGVVSVGSRGRSRVLTVGARSRLGVWGSPRQQRSC